LTLLPTIVDNVEEHCLETTIDGHLALLVYRRNAKRFVIVHTEVPDALAGRGVGGALVKAAIDLAAAAQLTVVPSCPFAREWLHRHPEEAGRVTVHWPGE
jgi:predicted GNAT family acetyltransferase